MAEAIPWGPEKRGLSRGHSWATPSFALGAEGKCLEGAEAFRDAVSRDKQNSALAAASGLPVSQGCASVTTVSLAQS